jgi:glycosyltransferase involved in cell wall biosynthesis
VSRHPLLSLIITSYTTQRLRDIFELLDSVKTQTYPNIEIIFVVERSTELYERVSAYARENGVLDMKVFLNGAEWGLSASRNVGIKSAAGEIIAFVDDDVLLFPNWAQEMAKTYEDDSIIGITGPALPLWEDESMSWLPKELYWLVSCTGWCDWSVLTEVRNAWGHNMSFKREAFESCGLFSNQYGFHKGFMAEDNEFSMRVKARLGKRIVYDPHVKVWHRVHKYRLGWHFIMERACWIGYSRRTIKRFQKDDCRSEDMLFAEHQLIKQILFVLPPRILKDAFKHPILAWRKFSTTFIVLVFVSFGYSNIKLVRF